MAYSYKNIIGDHVSGLRRWVGGEGEDDDGVEQQPQRAGHAPAGQFRDKTKSKWWNRTDKAMPYPPNLFNQKRQDMI